MPSGPVYYPHEFVLGSVLLEFDTPLVPHSCLNMLYMVPCQLRLYAGHLLALLDQLQPGNKYSPSQGLSLKLLPQSTSCAGGRAQVRLLSKQFAQIGEW